MLNNENKMRNYVNIENTPRLTHLTNECNKDYSFPLLFMDASYPNFYSPFINISPFIIHQLLKYMSITRISY